jgi:AraC-like DNA-binding protein
MAETRRIDVRPSTIVSVDALASLLDGPRGRGAFLLRTCMEPPWSVRFADGAPLGLFAMLHGAASLIASDGAAVHLAPGDVAVIKGADPVTFADDPATPCQVVIHPGPRLTTADGEDIGTAMDIGVRTWGNDPDGRDVSLVGCFQMRGEISQRLVDALPAGFALRKGEWDTPLIALLAEEMARDEPGQQAVLDRLFDLLLIAAIRAHLGRLGDDAPAWYRAHHDPVVGRAVRMLHEDPARPWTVAALAAECGTSRARFARRFSELVGEPPMGYLMRWRLALAADLLREPQLTVETVATRVGYSNGFALSSAFKRVRGVSPTSYRHQLAGV